MSKEHEINVPNEIVESMITDGLSPRDFLCLPSGFRLNGFGAVYDEATGTMIVEWVFWVEEVEPS